MKDNDTMIELFEYVLIALACPLLLPILTSEDSEVGNDN